MKTTRINTLQPKARGLARRIQEMSHLISVIEHDHPINGRDNPRKEVILKSYIGFKHDLRDIANELEGLESELTRTGGGVS